MVAAFRGSGEKGDAHGQQNGVHWEPRWVLCSSSNAELPLSRRARNSLAVHCGAAVETANVQGNAGGGQRRGRQKTREPPLALTEYAQHGRELVGCKSPV